MQTVTIEMDIPLQILKTEDPTNIKNDITSILLNKRTYSAKALADLTEELYAGPDDQDNTGNDLESEIRVRFGKDIYGDFIKQAADIEKIECEIAETLDGEGYLAKNIICNVGIEDPKANKVMTNVSEDIEISGENGDSASLFRPDMNYITCEMLQMKIHPKELENLRDVNGEFTLASFNEEIATHVFKLCSEPNNGPGGDQGEDGETNPTPEVPNLESFKIAANKTQHFHFNHQFD